MERSTKYVALDVHQATTAASVHEAIGRVIARTLLPMEEGAIAGFFQGLRGAVLVTFWDGDPDAAVARAAGPAGGSASREYGDS